ncbi:two-component sensor histidine kinase [Marmoricola endophyticus]|uniref:Sensor-like histidine kinase SenX3 n=1 Tax=Marmoricola endophyticus TaxID=2040280 RepID=A0A917BPR8_9ACTN|nr:ATP-binding protein [Marmoricola endophyticus]GGF51962.1 two-component sensor histidine kinase [Marmoricola endophyticus]
MRTIARVGDGLHSFLLVLLGVVLGGSAVLAWRISEIQQARARAAPPPTLPEGVTGVLSVLRSSALVVDSDDRVRKATAPTYAMGVLEGDQIADERLREEVRAVRRDGQIRELELQHPRPGEGPARTLAVRIAPLGVRLVLVLLEDRTRERRVEAIRRDFVANVSHELKTPVGAIRLLSEAVEEAADDPEAVQRFASRMGVESQRLGRLVQQIIELSRLQDDDPIEALSSVDLDAVIDRVIDENATDAADKQIAVVRDGDADVALLGNTEQVALALGNLVANAIGYSPDSSRVVIHVTARSGDVDIAVTDQGIGIPAPEIDRIFERFYRVDPARHRSTGGTGLGLSIVKHVVASHGGEVKVWSVEGAGSTFTLTLPRKQAAARRTSYDDIDLDEDLEDGPVEGLPETEERRPATVAGRPRQEERR